MKHYAFFYHLRNNSYVEGVGDRSVLRLDGRNNLHNMKEDARQWGIKHKYDGFRIVRGHLLNPFYLTAAVIPIKRT